MAFLGCVGCFLVTDKGQVELKGWTSVSPCPAAVLRHRVELELHVDAALHVAAQVEIARKCKFKQN
jgi:hypothetical protein